MRIGMPMTNGILPRRMLVFPEFKCCNLLIRTSSRSHFPQCLSVQWYQWRVRPVLRANAVVILMFSLSLLSLSQTIIGASFHSQSFVFLALVVITLVCSSW
jgi:hypothetical protein